MRMYPCTPAGPGEVRLPMSEEPLSGKGNEGTCPVFPARGTGVPCSQQSAFP